MIWVWIAAAALLAVGLGLIARRRKRRRAAVRDSGQKHDAGYLKYHRLTRVEVKRALKRPAKAGKNPPDKTAIAVVKFKGDMRASQNAGLALLVDEILLNRESFTEVVVTVESPGGSVTEYGQSFSLMQRLRDANLRLTVCVDTVAASGGYLMALPAHKIVAAPFAMVGSIGVVSFVPNFRKFLEKHDIQPRTFTAGNSKRTVTFTDDASPEQVQRYEKQLELIHDQFKSALVKYRPGVDPTRAATGEAWLAQSSQELGLGLVDALGTSSEYLLQANENADLVFFDFKKPRKGLARLLGEFAVQRTLGALGARL